MNKTTQTLLALSVLVSICVNAEEEISVDEIVKRSDAASYYSGKDGRAEVNMTITDGNGGERVREFVILRLNKENKDQKYYVYFKSPPDVRKMAYLVWKNVGKADDRWLWLPALNLNKRIAPGDKRTSFVGSDFLYEDVSGRSIDDDRHELITTGADSYLIKCTPKDPASVEFSYYNVWIDKGDFLPRKAEYYDKNDKLYRRVEALKVDTKDGFPTVIEAVASDLKSGSSTKNVFSNVEYDVGLNESIFTERFLRRPPREIER